MPGDAMLIPFNSAVALSTGVSEASVREGITASFSQDLMVLLPHHLSGLLALWSHRYRPTSLPSAK